MQKDIEGSPETVEIWAVFTESLHPSEKIYTVPRYKRIRSIQGIQDPY